MESLTCSGINCFLNNSHYIVGVIATLYVAPFINIITAYKNVTPLYKPILRHEYSVKKVLNLMLLPYLIFFLAFFFLKSHPSLQFFAEFICVIWLILVVVKLYTDSIVLTFDLRSILAKKIKKSFKGDRDLAEQEIKKVKSILLRHDNNKRKKIKKPDTKIKRKRVRFSGINIVDINKFKNFLNNLPSNVYIRFEDNTFSFFDEKNNSDRFTLCIYFIEKIPFFFETKLKWCFKVKKIPYLDDEIEKSYKNIFSHFIDLAKSNQSEKLFKEINFIKHSLSKDLLEKMLYPDLYTVLDKIFENDKGRFDPYIKESFFQLWIFFLGNCADVHSMRYFVSVFYKSLKNDFWKETKFNSGEIIKQEIKRGIRGFFTEIDFIESYISSCLAYYIRGVKDLEEHSKHSYNVNIFLELIEDSVKYYKENAEPYPEEEEEEFFDLDDFENRAQEKYDLCILLAYLFLYKKNHLKKVRDDLLKKIKSGDFLFHIYLLQSYYQSESDLDSWNRVWVDYRWEELRLFKIKDFLISFLVDFFKDLENIRFLKNQYLRPELIDTFLQVKSKLEEDKFDPRGLEILDNLIQKAKNRKGKN